MDVLIGSLVLALLCMVCGANLMALTLLGDVHEYRDLWRAWREGDWPTLERLESARYALAQEQQRNEELQRRLRDLMDKRDGRRPMARVRGGALVGARTCDRRASPAPGLARGLAVGVRDLAVAMKSAESGDACPQTSESESESESESLQRPAPKPTQPYARKDG